MPTSAVIIIYHHLEILFQYYSNYALWAEFIFSSKALHYKLFSMLKSTFSLKFHLKYKSIFIMRVPPLSPCRNMHFEHFSRVQKAVNTKRWKKKVDKIKCKQYTNYSVRETTRKISILSSILLTQMQVLAYRY